MGPRGTDGQQCCHVRLSKTARLAISIRRRRTGPPRSGIRMVMTPGSVLDYTETGSCVDSYLDERNIAPAVLSYCTLVTLPLWLRSF